MGSPSSMARIVVGIPFKAVGTVVKGKRSFTQYHRDTGKPFVVQGDQTVVTLNGVHVPDDPTGRNWDRRTTDGHGDPHYGTNAIHNLCDYLVGIDKRWKGSRYEDDIREVVIDFDLLGVVAQEVDHDYDNDGYAPLSVNDIAQATEQFKDMMSKLNIKVEPIVFLVSKTFS